LLAHLFIAADQALGIPELLLEILSHLDQVNLVNTALVNKHWLTQTRQVLYRAPDLSGADGAECREKAELLLQALAGWSGLGPVVRKLSLTADDDFCWDGAWLLPLPPYITLDRMSDSHPIRHLLPFCSRLESVVLSGEHGWHGQLGWVSWRRRLIRDRDVPLWELQM
jgi:hypothetical protein